MVTLDTFYQSKEWLRFRQVVINQRTKEDGYIYDEITGKPIVKSYDIILHHKIFLTEDNVNNAAIALNPDNIQIVSHKTHNLIHNKFGYQRQEVYLVYGSPLSGKTTYVNTVANSSDLILDVDKIWGAICPASEYEKPPCLNSIVFGVRDFLLDCIRIRRGKWKNAYIIGGYPLVSERERLCRQLGAREVYIESTKEMCLERLKKDERRNKKDWENYINTWWERYTIPPVD